MIGPYDTPQAFRAALQAQLRNVARQRGTDLQRLQRRVAFAMTWSSSCRSGWRRNRQFDHDQEKAVLRRNPRMPTWPL